MYAVGQGPAFVAVADFNGDGITDLAVTNQTDNTVSVLLGRGNGTFQPQQTDAVGLNPKGIAVADFNGDGIGDLAVANILANPPTVSVLLGSGNGTFQPQQTYTVGAMPYGIAVADFNGDGVPDVANANNAGDSVSILLGGTVNTGQLKNVPVEGSGMHAIQSTYTPDQGFYAGSLSSINVNGSLIPTSTTLAITANGKPISSGGEVVSGTAIVVNATVMPGTLGNLVATGTVSFFDGDTLLATVAMTIDSDGNGVASLSPSLGLGQHSLSAVYSGDNNFGPSNSRALQLTVVGAFSVTLAASPNPATSSSVATLTATLSNSSGLFAGTVTFLDGKQALATVEVVGKNPAPGFVIGTATLKTRFAPGSHSLQAVFNGLGQIPGSMAQSLVQTLTVTGTEPSITTLTDQPDGNNFDLTVSVFGFGFPAPTGLVMFNDFTNGFNLGNVMLAGPGTWTFQPQGTYGVGVNPYGVAVADFNGDGFPDFVVADQGDGTVAVRLGNGDGTFQPQQVSQAGAGPFEIAVGDFNGDGILDLVVSNLDDNTVSVLLGNGNGTFQPQTTYPVGGNPTGIVVADLDGDGIPDVAVASFDDGTVSVLLGKGNGMFRPRQTYATGQFPYGVAVGDFNRDGIADLAVANEGENTVSVLLGNGDGTFQQPQAYATGIAPVGVAVGDFNGDGIADLAVTNFGENTVSVLLGNDGGTFQAQQQYHAANSPFQIVTTDFNGDGIPDLAVTNNPDGTASVLLGKGDGTFQPPQGYSAGSASWGIAAGDLNGDGVPDLAMANVLDDTVSILLGGTVSEAQLNNVPIIGSGIHTIQSSYAPDASSIYAASLSNTVMVPAGGKATPSVTLTGSPSPGISSPPTSVNYGNNETFTAVVKSPAGGTPTGTVNFMEGSTLLGTGSLVANANGQGSVASYTNNTLVIGQHLVTATYNGDSNFNSATPSPPVTVTVITPFMLIPEDGSSGTVSPGGNITFSVAVNAAWQDHPLIYAVMNCQPPAGTGITCSVMCPPSPSTPPGLSGLCVLTGADPSATVTVSTSGSALLVLPLHRGGERRVIATLMGLGGIGLVGMVLLPFKLRRKAVGGGLFLVVVILCFGTSCGTSFAPGVTSPPVNNTVYISVNAELREENPLASTGYNTLGIQTFLYSLLIK